jgi:hypothetical protein
MTTLIACKEGEVLLEACTNVMNKTYQRQLLDTHTKLYAGPEFSLKRRLLYSASLGCPLYIVVERLIRTELFLGHHKVDIDKSPAPLLGLRTVLRLCALRLK